jgi:anti-sigma regulatory factor (Ser/Thr protein kinase)
VVALTRLTAPEPREVRWQRVEDPSAVAGCRAAAVAIAGQLEFPASRRDEVALAVTEAASNLQKHAKNGALMLRGAAGDDGTGIELVTIDAGPGMRDVRAAMRDGHSTAGSLGIGLGAIRRLASFCDLYSSGAGRGTALAARFGPAPGPESVLPRWAGLARPIAGEAECGDTFAAVQIDDVVTAVLCDGLGHGPLAAAASRAAVDAVLAEPAAEPAVLLERVHRRISHTRGGAIGIVQLTGQLARFAGLGNVAGWILADGGRTGMASVPGIVGHQARAFRQFEYTVPAGAAVILHSDGLSSRWDALSLPGLAGRDPLLIAAVLLAEAGVHRDDAGILVVAA